MDSGATAYPSRFLTFMRYGMAARRAHPPGELWYLVALGVRPDAQRGGVGRRLLTPVLDCADADGVACHLEASDWSNVEFYERLGFTIVDDDLRLVPGGPSNVSMRREPVSMRREPSLT